MGGSLSTELQLLINALVEADRNHRPILDPVLWITQLTATHLLAQIVSLRL